MRKYWALLACSLLFLPVFQLCLIVVAPLAHAAGDEVSKSLDKIGNTYVVTIRIDGQEVISDNAVADDQQASQKLLDDCNMWYVGRFTKSIKELDSKSGSHKVPSATKPTKERPLWDVMASHCTVVDGQYVPGYCTFINWQVLPGDDGEVALLAKMAEGQLKVPRMPVKMPWVTMPDGRQATYVRGATWFWTDPKKYHPWSTKAQLGKNWARVTATPISMELTPRPGVAPVICQGPGEVYDYNRHNRAFDAPSGCSYRYEHTTGKDPNEQTVATFGVRWQVSWEGSNGKGGPIAQVVTTESQVLQVIEAQTVVVR
jgi:hypothetical protein